MSPGNIPRGRSDHDSMICIIHILHDMVTVKGFAEVEMYYIEIRAFGLVLVATMGCV